MSEDHKSKLTQSRAFRFSDEHLQYLESVRRKAQGASVGRVSVSHVLEDIIEYAKQTGYDKKFQ